jgi:hypothetical protein
MASGWLGRRDHMTARAAAVERKLLDESLDKSLDGVMGFLAPPSAQRSAS